MRGSLRQRRPGSWELRVHAGRDSATGKPAYVTRTVRGDRDAAERGLVALVAQIADSPTSPTFGTVGELWEDVLARARLAARYHPQLVLRRQHLSKSSFLNLIKSTSQEAWHSRENRLCTSRSTVNTNFYIRC